MIAPNAEHYEEAIRRLKDDAFLLKHKVVLHSIIKEAQAGAPGKPYVCYLGVQLDCVAMHVMLEGLPAMIANNIVI